MNICKLISWSKVILDELVTEPERSLPQSKKPTTGPLPQPDELSPHPHTTSSYYFKIYFIFSAMYV